MIHRQLLRLFLTSLVMVSLSQCAAIKKAREGKKEDAEPENTSKTRTLLIGTVELVNPEQQYVLILKDPSMIIPAGTELSCLDATGTVSKIVTTPEQKGNYIAADITQGSPRVKNLVLHVVHENASDLAAMAAGVSPAMNPAIPPMASNEPLDSGLPPLNEDTTIEPGSISVPPGGIDLQAPGEPALEFDLTPLTPTPNPLPPVVE